MVSLGAIEPVVLMGQLESVLTKRPVMDILGDPGHASVVSRDGGDRMVIPVGHRLEHALASLEQASIPQVAAAWAEAEEFWGQVGPTDLIDPISRLVALAQQALATSQHMYCWMCV